MIAYRLDPLYGIKEEVYEYLYDEGEDFTNKKSYIERAKQLTKRVNKEFKTTYTWTDLFETPNDIGFRFCKKCGAFYWGDDCCEC